MLGESWDSAIGLLSRTSKYPTKDPNPSWGYDKCMSRQELPTKSTDPPLGVLELRVLPAIGTHEPSFEI